MEGNQIPKCFSHFSQNAHFSINVGSIHDWGTKKKCLIFLMTIKDNFGFSFILHYYSCSGLLYANR
jgi:hypothetical protein